MLPLTHALALRHSPGATAALSLAVVAAYAAVALAGALRLFARAGRS